MIYRNNPNQRIFLNRLRLSLETSLRGDGFSSGVETSLVVIEEIAMFHIYLGYP